MLFDASVEQHLLNEESNLEKMHKINALVADAVLF